MNTRVRRTYPVFQSGGATVSISQLPVSSFSYKRTALERIGKGGTRLSSNGVHRAPIKLIEGLAVWYSRNRIKSINQS